MRTATVISALAFGLSLLMTINVVAPAVEPAVPHVVRTESLSSSAVPSAEALSIVRNSAECQLNLRWENRLRRVPGPVNEECGCDYDSSCPDTGDECHSCIFGNWGVDTMHTAPQDANQFSGWIPEADGTFEWNSCTSLCQGNCYNDGPTGQKANPDLDRSMATYWDTPIEVEDDLGCKELNQEIEHFDLDATIMEMDGWPVSWADQIVTLSYTSEVTLSCPEEDHCDRVDGAWVDDSSGATPVEAEARAIVLGAQLCPDGC